MKRFLLSFCFTGLLSLTAQAAAVDPNPKSLEINSTDNAKARELVQKLASPSFHVRDNASRELDKLGRAALPAIKDGLKETNAEVQLRCELLLSKATDDDIKARIACFLADNESKYNHQLPGAKQFFAIAGQSDSSRNLFRDIFLSANRPMMMAMEGKPDDLQLRITERKSEFQQNNGGVIINGTVGGVKQMSVVDVVAILFVESFVSDAGRRNVVYPHILSQASLQSGLNDAKMKEPVIAIVSKWMDTREDPYNMYMALNTARNQKLPNAMNLAIRLLDTKNASITYRGQAISYIAQYGTKDHIPKILPLLKDETQLTTVFVAANNRHVIQVRDTALSSLLHITKQKHDHYGFVSRYKGTVPDTTKYSYFAYYFDDADGKKRAEALKKWEEWYAKNKDAKEEKK
jgi:hypothetical protein